MRSIGIWPQLVAVFTAVVVEAGIGMHSTKCGPGQFRGATDSCHFCPQGTFKSEISTGEKLTADENPDESAESCIRCPNKGAFSPAGSNSSRDCIGGIPPAAECTVGHLLHGRQPHSFWRPLETCSDLTWHVLPGGLANKVRYGHTAVSVEEFVIVFGGHVVDAVGYAWGHDDDAVHVLDAHLPRLTWMTAVVEGVKPPPRHFHSAVLHESKMIVYGGIGSSSSLQDIAFPWMLDTTTFHWQKVGQWEEDGPGRNPLYGHTSVMNHDGSEMIVFGGKTVSSASSSCLSDVWTLSTDRWTWARRHTSGADPPGLCWHSSVAVGQQMIVLGGHSDHEAKGASGGVWELNTKEWRWTRLSSPGLQDDAPTSIRSAVLYQGRIAALSGACQSQHRCDIFYFNLNNRTWQAISVSAISSAAGEQSSASIAVGGQAQRVVATDSSVFVLGGASENDFSAYIIRKSGHHDALGISEVFFLSDSRRSPNRHPSPRERSAAAVLGDAVVLFGGVSTSLSMPHRIDFAYLRDTWILDLRTSTWQEVTESQSGPCARHGHTMISNGPAVLLFGGARGYVSPSSWLPCRTCASATVIEDRDFAVFNDVWVLAGSMGSRWSRLDPTNAPPGREGHTAVRANSSMVVIGGVDFSAAEATVYDDIWVLDLVSHSWNEVTPVNQGPGALFHHAAVVHGERILIIAGCRIGSNDTLQFLSELWSLHWHKDSSLWTWQMMDGKSDARAGHSALLIGSSVVMFGGYRLDPTCSEIGSRECVESCSDTWKLWMGASNDDAWEWTKVEVLNPPTPRRHHVAVLTGPDYFVMGGGHEWVGSDGHSWKTQYQDAASLPISSVASTGLTSGVYFALALDYMSVLLRERILFGGARMRAAHVLIEPHQPGSSALLLVAAAAALQCDVADGCTDLVLRSLDMRTKNASCARAATPLVLARGAGTRVSVLGGSFVGVHCRTMGCAIKLEDEAHGLVRGVLFQNGWAGQLGGAIASVGAHLSASSCVFDGLGADGAGGAIAVSSAQFVHSRGELGAKASAVLHNITFRNNFARHGGGALSCGELATCNISACTFVSNHALDTAYGGAILTKGFLTVTRSVFDANTAIRGGGGAVFWQDIRPVFDAAVDQLVCTGDSFGARIALFGPCVASNAMRVLFGAGEGYTQTLVNQFPGLFLGPHLRATVLDFYNQSVVVDEAQVVPAHIHVNNGAHAVLLGASSVVQALNSTLFEFWDLHVLPAYSFVGAENASLASSSVSLTLLVDDVASGRTLRASVDLRFEEQRVCPQGHVLQLSRWDLSGLGGSDAALVGACKQCPPSTYTLHPLHGHTANGTHSPGQTPSCLQCPVGAVCSGGDALEGLGEWEADGFEFVLMSCPVGYARLIGTEEPAGVQYQHNKQQCKPCRTDGTEYVLDSSLPGTGCQACPAGLLCFGDERTLPEVDHSLWLQVGEVLVLRSCPVGFELVNATLLGQQCKPCIAGSHNVDGAGKCELCSPGTFKESRNPEACRPCLTGSYSQAEGATSCHTCPRFASTAVGALASSRPHCQCEGLTYAVGLPADFECASCPLGAVCPGAWCAMGSSNNRSRASGLSCASGSRIPGEWARADSNGFFHLLSCPAGHSLVNTSTGTPSGSFSHDAQHCSPCSPVGQYILHPNMDACQACPAGLSCPTATDVVIPKVAGSEWAADGPIYRLLSCPTGHAVYSGESSFDAPLQACIPCGQGSECRQQRCTECTQCRAGTYKDSVGALPCKPCPNNTFGRSQGASALAMCTRCPDFSETVGDGHAEPGACVCDARSYLQDSPQTGFACRSCPQGARCDSGECALQHKNITCPDGAMIVGTWERSADDAFVLAACPDGYERIISETGTANGSFSHDAQQCRRCLASQYVIDPSWNQCHSCPAGLVCSGGAQVVAKQPGAEWRAVAGQGLYELQACPSGHYMHAPSQLQQQCLPCQAGAHCPQASCVACALCPEGTYKETSGSYDCRECPRSTYQPAQGARSAADCAACPVGSFTAATAQSSIQSCVCQPTLYPAGAPYGQGEMMCVTCPQGAICAGSGSCALSYEGHTSNCSAGAEVVGVWNRSASDGRAVLESCPPGYSRVTSTASGSGSAASEFSHDLQACIPCAADEYVIHPNSDACQPCPRLGLMCDGTGSVVPVLNGSVWEVCDSCEESGATFVLQSCPSGYRRIRAPPSWQHCEPCGVGEECVLDWCEDSCTLCSPGHYKSTADPSACQPCPANTYNPNVGSTSEAECERCMEFGYTQGTGASRADDCLCQSGTYVVSPPGESRSCSHCAVGATCADGSCSFQRDPPACPGGAVPAGRWERSNATDLFVLLNCSDGFSLVNSVDGTSSGVFAHALQRCEQCSSQQYILRPDVHSCQRCPPGLICNGDSAVVPRLEDSVWVVNDAIYRLESCPTGHSVQSGSLGFVAEQQDCEPCGLGQQCVGPACSASSCSPCPRGTYKDSVSADACQKCPVNTYGSVEGAKVEEECERCPSGAVTAGTGHTARTACSCLSRLYPITDASMGLLACRTCPDGAACLSDGSCALNYDGPEKMCPDGAVVGTWNRSVVDSSALAGASYVLSDCPDGFRLINSSQLSSRGTFSHDRQACKKCSSNSYIISPMFECKGCQLGLVCSGNAHVTPLVLGAEVVPVGDTYWLASCPTGYWREGFNRSMLNAASSAQILQQACIPCSFGEECTDARCFTCEPCSKGSYKDEESPSPCNPCPLGTYGSLRGATSSTDCTRCPTGSVTLDLGETGPEACLCEPATYWTAGDLNTAFRCHVCPQGAMCSSGWCAVRFANQSCDGADIVGTWEADSEGVFNLERCPPGYSLTNQTAAGVFVYVAQRCVRCLATEYIIFPNSQECQLCPRGLECRGDSVVEARVSGSVWELVDGVFYLQQCPRGYLLENATLARQQCAGCPAGHECLARHGAACTQCSRCEKGFYKETSGPELCEPCARDTYNPDHAATSVSACLACPKLATTRGNASTIASDCFCSESTYQLSDDTSASGTEATGTAPVLSCSECPVGGVCSESETGFCALRNVNLTCPGESGDRIVGDWSRVSLGGMFVLMSCPSGYSLVNALDGTSTGPFWHGSQRCVKCKPGEAYVLNPNADPCNRCPAGLLCFGDERVTPVTNGSLWVVEGSALRLSHCPSGYSVYNGLPASFSPQAQECRPCLPGTFCSSERCEMCQRCPAGTYKELDGDAICNLCPNNTYSNSVGATSITQCKQCPAKSTTDAPGKTTFLDCVCDSAMYLVSNAELGEPTCVICPAGALCPGTRLCAVELPGFVCPGTGPIVGDWERDADNYMRLLSCPAGSSMINSSTGTTFGTFEHDVQQCVVCKTCQVGQVWCSSAEYVIDPRRDTCKLCPYGAECNGSQLRTANSLDLLGALWMPDTHGAWWIRICPVGHRLMNHTGYANQQCLACPQGLYVFRSDHPRFTCHPCPAGATCLNGAPPVFGTGTVSSELIFFGLVDNPSDFSSLEHAVLVASLQQAIPSPPGSVEITEICDASGLNCTSEGALLRRRSLPPGTGTPMPIMLSESRRLLQTKASKISVRFQVLSDTLTTSSLQDQLSRPDFTSSLSRSITQIEPAFGAISIDDMQPPALNAPPSSRGEQYIFDEAGRANLWFCGTGYLLVNDTFSLQQCSTCYPTTYTLNPTDYCEADGICAMRDCSRCPRGARCDGGSHFEGLVGSTWETVYHKDVRALLYRVTSCSLGQLLVRVPELPAIDQCLDCPAASYAMEATDVNETFLRPLKGESVIGDLLCLGCPRGATCPGQLAVNPNEGFWRGEDMLCPNSQCDSLGVCNPMFCETYPESPLEPGRQGDDVWRVRALVFPCRPRHCLGSVGDLDNQAGRRNQDGNRTADSDESGAPSFVNACRKGHQGRLCGTCLSGWTMSGTTCRYCGKTGSSSDGFVGSLVFLALALALFAYLAAWRPLLQEYEARVLGACFPRADDGEAEETGTGRSWWERVQVEVGEGAVTDWLKALISFFQVSGSFVLKVNVVWPQALLDYLLTMAAVCHLDIFSLPGLSCVFDELSFQEKLLLTTLAVPLIIAFLGIPTLYTRHRSRQLQDQCTNHFLYCALFFLFLTYNYSSRLVLEAFACADLGVDGQWLKSDSETVCPAADSDKLTFGWAVACVVIYPVGIPCLMLYLLLHLGVHTSVSDKMKRSYMHATLEKYKMQNAVPLLVAKRLSKHLRRLKKEFAHRIEAVKQVRVKRLQDDGLDRDASAIVEEREFKLVVDDLRELLAGLHIEDRTHSELQHVIDRYGSQGTIVCKELVSMVEQAVKSQSVLSGEEDAESLTLEQLQKLCEAGQFEEAHYAGSASGSKRDTYRRKRHHREGSGGAGPGQLGARPASGYRFEEREELTSLLLRRAATMEAKGELDIPEPVWDGASKPERRAIHRLGFLLNTYRARYWWFAVADLVHKVLMCATGSFAFEGTPSQLGVGLIVTVSFLVLTLVTKPFRYSTIGNMHEYSLCVQAITYFYGIMLASSELDEWVGDKGSQERETAAGFILFINVLILVFPLLARLLALCLQPAFAHIRKSMVSPGAPLAESKKAVLPAEEEESASESNSSWPEILDVVMALRQFLQMRWMQAGHAYDESEYYSRASLHDQHATAAAARPPPQPETPPSESHQHGQSPPESSSLRLVKASRHQPGHSLSSSHLQPSGLVMSLGEPIPSFQPRTPSANPPASSPSPLSGARPSQALARHGSARAAEDTGEFEEIVEYAASRPRIVPSPVPFEPRNSAVSFEYYGMSPAPESSNHNEYAASRPRILPSSRPFEPRNSAVSLEFYEMSPGPESSNYNVTPPPPSPLCTSGWKDKHESLAPGDTDASSGIQKHVMRFQGESFPEEDLPLSIEEIDLMRPSDDDRPLYPWDKRPPDDGIQEELTFISDEEVARRKTGMGIVRVHSGRELKLAVAKMEEKAAAPAKGTRAMVRERWKRSTRKPRRKGDRAPPPWPAHDYDGSSSEEDEEKIKISDLATGAKRVLDVRAPELIETLTRGPADLEISMFNPISRINLPLLAVHGRFEAFSLHADLVHADASETPETQGENPPVGGIGAWC